MSLKELRVLDPNAGTRLHILLLLSCTLFLMSCGARHESVSYFQNLSCAELAINLDLPTNAPQEGNNLCHLNAKTKLLAICGETYTEYNILTEQIDGYTMFPSWNSLNNDKLQTACDKIQQNTGSKTKSCLTLVSEFTNRFQGIDRNELKSGATIVAITYESNRLETTVFNWDLKSLKDVSFHTSPDQTYSDISLKPCLYSDETDFSSVAFPALKPK
jgi:uncharacterized lipoprotein YehR (DUF1307 family)